MRRALVSAHYWAQPPGVHFSTSLTTQVGRAPVTQMIISLLSMMAANNVATRRAGGPQWAYGTEIFVQSSVDRRLTNLLSEFQVIFSLNYYTSHLLTILEKIADRNIIDHRHQLRYIFHISAIMTSIHKPFMFISDNVPS